MRSYLSKLQGLAGGQVVKAVGHLVLQVVVLFLTGTVAGVVGTVMLVQDRGGIV